eukprot:TRINITY_DN8485_c0_g2_i1.p1 TRINITY_DN8485_c0_g2~~TRINITY_DN8485_c0_g2_i1.p1  ORF type:complete len:361 (+),score=57.65 TRINITY_DN8485_c0_g2_i1:100-1182(+)
MGCGASQSKYVQTVADQLCDIRDSYEIDKKCLGEGAYGSVNRAREKATRAMRAVKTMEKSAIPSLGMIRTEISIMKALDHVNICKLFDSFEDKKRIYLVMELCCGGNLFEYICDIVMFTEMQAAVVMQSMFRAVHYMHERQVAHRDLKPDNFLLLSKEEIETNVIKLADFGYARKFEVDQILTTRCGTAYYVAPQVIAGQYNHLADMWSLGVIMYVMLCGYPPFQGDNDVEVMQQVRLGKVTFEKSDWEGVSKDAQRFIGGLLKYKPDDRFGADQSLNHPWVTNFVKQSKNSNSLEISLCSTLSTASTQRLKRFVDVQAAGRKTNRKKGKELPPAPSHDPCAKNHSGTPLKNTDSALVGG